MFLITLFSGSTFLVYPENLVLRKLQSRFLLLSLHGMPWKLERGKVINLGSFVLKQKWKFLNPFVAQLSLMRKWGSLARLDKRGLSYHPPSSDETSSLVCQIATFAPFKLKHKILGFVPSL